MADDILKLDLYAIIGATIDSTEAEIKKAYRKKALTCHPDKCPDDPKAAELFLQLGKALEVLTDPKAKASYDNIIKAKEREKLRTKELDSKRRKLIDDLEARERSYRDEQEEKARQKSEEIRLKAHLEKLREEGSRILREAEQQLREEIRKQRAGEIDLSDSGSGQSGTVKLKWKADKKDETNGGYNQDNLYTFLSKYGDIAALAISKDKKGRALVEFKNREDAERAVQYESGLMSNPLKLKRMWDTKSTKTNRYGQNSQTSTVNDKDFEDLVLFNLRRAEERKRLIEQMKAEDEED